MKSSIIVALLTLTTASLSACSNPASCSGGVYRGDCIRGDDAPVVTTPAPASPAIKSPPAVIQGDPRDFADIDDKQCRSYGLAFGTRDYADCRIRLSAQHRGLDPNPSSPVNQH